MQSDEPIRLREIWPPGTVIKGDYVIEKKLGSGGCGSVYLARHRFFGSIHVIKRLHEQYASDPEYVRKFLNEGRAVRRLKGCPHIVEVEHMTQSDDANLILVMEYLDGGDLNSLMQSRTALIGIPVEAPPAKQPQHSETKAQFRSPKLPELRPAEQSPAPLNTAKTSQLEARQ